MSQGTAVLPAAQVLAVREICASIGQLDLDGPPALRHVVIAAQQAFGFEAAVAYRLRREEGETELELLEEADHARRAPGFLGSAFRRQLSSAHGFQPAYNSARPEPRWRNRVTVWSQAEFPPTMVELMGRGRLTGAHQMRTLICEGSTLLAWFGGFRYERPSIAEARLFAELVTPLKRRLVLERRLGDVELWKSGLAAALEVLGTPAYVASHRGVALANRAGEVALARSRSEIARVREAATRGSPAFEVTPLKARGMARAYLVVERRDRGELAARVARAASELALTKREAEVLCQLVAGEPTKLIADRRGCAMRTVEAHTTSIFRKAKVEGRAALLAQFWSR